MTTQSGPLPECWGHRGASASFPENTLASFEAAMRDGAEGIESDVHVSSDDVIVMFHDPSLERTTGSKGLIRERKWHGEDGMEHCRTIKEPRQPIPTFAQTVALLMRDENKHVKFNVDVKVQNDPNHLFELMHAVISSYPDWEAALAPRIILGLWHPRFIKPANEKLPYLKRAYIGMSPYIAREFFWDCCDAFSMNFGALCTSEGEAFRRDAKKAGKSIMVWTVNKPEEMMEATRWGVQAILTDVTKVWLDLRKALSADYKAASKLGRAFLWTSFMYYSPPQMLFWRLHRQHLEKLAGPFEKPLVSLGTASA